MIAIDHNLGSNHVIHVQSSNRQWKRKHRDYLMEFCLIRTNSQTMIDYNLGFYHTAFDGRKEVWTKNI